MAGVDAREFVFVAFIFGGGLVSFFNGFRVLRQRRMMENIPTSTVRGMAMGLVEVCGKAGSRDVLKSPLTSTDCIYYRYTVEEYRREGKHSRWQTIDSGNSGNRTFYLDDGTGVVLVHPKAAQFEMKVDFKFENGWNKPLPQHLVDFMDKRGLSYKAFLGQRSLRFNEWYIMPGQDVYVLGTAGKYGDIFNNFFNDKIAPDDYLPQEKTYQGQGQLDDVVISKGSDEKTFIISDSSQEELLKRFSLNAVLLVFGGMLAALGGLGWLVTIIQRLTAR